MKKITLRIGGMTCINCQNKIEKKLRNIVGVKKAEIRYNDGIANIIFDSSIVSAKNITDSIENLGYTIKFALPGRSDLGHIIRTLAVIVSLYMLLQQFNILNLLVPSQLADTKMGYGMLFIIGLITSIHCVAMCGGINLSQCIGHQNNTKKSRLSIFFPAFLYNLGRVISYTVIGFILGFAGLLFSGGADAGLPAAIQGILKLIAGIFMAIIGLNMLGIFPWLRKLQPGIPKMFINKVEWKNSSPLIVGLLNGFMPCGPLQSIQIVALASANPFIGAFSMFMFSLGTVPLMLGLGSIVSALGKIFTQKVMNIGAVLVVVLGLAMISQGGSLSGLLSPSLLLYLVFALSAAGIVSSIPFHNSLSRNISLSTTFGVVIILAVISLSSVNKNTAKSGIKIAGGSQIIKSELSPRSYPNIVVQNGVPVKWTIDAPQNSINGCNNTFNLQEYNISNYTFKPGENIIEFTPTETGQFDYSCWMGMIHGTITVVDGNNKS